VDIPHQVVQRLQGASIGIFGHQQHGQQAWTGIALGQRLQRQRRRHRLVFAGFTPVHQPDMLQHAHLHRNDVELFADDPNVFFCVGDVFVSRIAHLLLAICA